MIAKRALGETFPFLADLILNVRYLFKEDPTQYGELEVLKKYLPPSGSFVELGGWMPVAYSNSYALKRLGFSYRGVSVDPTPSLRWLWRLFRPRDKFESVAVVSRKSKGRDVTLECYRRRFSVVNRVHIDGNLPSGTLSLDSDVYGPPRQVRVPAVTLLELLKTYPASSGRLTLLMTDIEGLDVEVLADLQRLEGQLPHFILAEDHNATIHSLLDSLGYEFLQQVGPSKFFRHTTAPS